MVFGVIMTAGTNVKRTMWVSRLGISDSLQNGGESGVQAEIVAKAVDAFGPQQRYDLCVKGLGPESAGNVS